MTDAKPRWDDVASALNGLGLKLKMHLEQAKPDDHRVEDALRNVADAIGQSFEALGNAVDDPAVRADAASAARSLLDAVGATFEDLGDRLSSVIKGR